MQWLLDMSCFNTFFNTFFRMAFLLIFFLLSLASSTLQSEWMACSELSPVLRLPCRCRVEQIAVNGQTTSIGMDCDRIVFSSETLQIPKGAPISSFSQRHSGQSLPTPVRHIFANLIFFSMPSPHYINLSCTLHTSSIKHFLLILLYSHVCALSVVIIIIFFFSRMDNGLWSIDIHICKFTDNKTWFLIQYHTKIVR